MGISKKTLLIVASISGAIILSLFFYLQFYVLEQYIELEKIDLTNKIIQSVKILNTNVESLDKITTTISSSGDTYSFLNTQDEKNDDHAVSEELLKDIDADLFLLVDDEDNIKLEKFISPDNQTEGASPGQLKDMLLDQQYLERIKSSTDGISGISVIESIPYIIVAKPVLAPGSPSGEEPTEIIITGQMLDEEILDELVNIQKNPVNLYNLGNDEIQDSFSDIIASLQGGNSYDVKYLPQNNIAGYTLIKDIDSNPVLLLEVKAPRSIYLEGRNNVYTFFIFLFFMGLISSLTIFLLLEKSFLSRIVRLSKESEEIGKSNDLTKKVQYSGNDEISKLAISINRMLRDLRRNQLDIMRSEKRFKDLVELLPEIVIETDTDQKIIFANQPFFDVFGYDEKDLKKGLYVKEIIESEDIGRFNEKIEFLKKGEKTEGEEYRAVKKDRSTFPMLMSSVVTFNEYGVPGGFRTIAMDITSRKKAEEQLRELEARWEFALEGSGDGVWDWNFENNEVFYSRRLKELLGFDETELKNDFNEVMDRIHPKDVNRVKGNIEKHLRGETRYYTADYRIMKRDGSYMWAEDRGKVIRWDKEGKPLRMIGTFTDITVRKELEEEIKRLAYRDPLTNLPNRLLFNDRVELTIASSRRYSKRFALMIIDVDKFKKINDTYGHDVGDKLILHIGAKIQEILRKSDTIARFGGDEFLLLLPDIRGRQDVEKIAKKIFDLFQKKMIIDGKKLSSTLSMGISIFPDDGEDSSTLLKNADTALYEVKDSGRNNYKFYQNSY